MKTVILLNKVKRLKYLEFLIKYCLKINLNAIEDCLIMKIMVRVVVEAMEKVGTATQPGSYWSSFIYFKGLDDNCYD